ncbi:hypothetical protein H696_06190 [Fonticula alba]|uniref:PPIase cyclophilin-type domain-containing protein n=1 Tax=Fonticula alba TaxID=691883 RepID=A0A058YZS8_FONAL|nr:hypothetical protein H696_06190 [Fonticula alba]KCV67386.1 hypothetical protein H696_06190 [Fonticula alba]|eukprot:XP_009498209.1 hypothetical protein H696_06190 [Fonticula alba]
MSRRRGWVLPPLGVLLLGILLLFGGGGARAAPVGPAVLLHRTLLPVDAAGDPAGAGRVLSLFAGQAAVRSTADAEHRALLFGQSAADFVGFDDARVGSVFGPDPEAILPAAPSGVANFRAAAWPGPGGPRLVGFGTNRLAFLTGPGAWDVGQMVLGVFQDGGYAEHRTGVFSFGAKVKVLPAGEDSFAILSGRNLMTCYAPWGGPFEPGGHLAVGRVVDGVVARLAAGWPRSRAVLLADGQIEVCLGVDPCGVQCAGAAYEVALPAGAPGGGRFPHPTLFEEPEVTPWLVYLPPAGQDPAAGRAWRLTLGPDGQAAGWQALILPPGPSLEGMRMVRLRVGPGGAPRWVLADGHAYLSAGDFHCAGVDGTIECDDPAAVEAGAERQPAGFRCAPGRALSPLALAGSLCAGCADGHFFVDAAGPGAWVVPSVGLCRAWPCLLGRCAV